VSGVGFGATLGDGFGFAGVGERFMTEFCEGCEDIISLCEPT